MNELNLKQVRNALVITEKDLHISLFAELQSIELAKGSCHYGDYSQWCISGKDIEQAIINLFAEEGVFKPTKDCNECESATRANTVRKMQERLKQAICDNTYPDFNKAGKPVNVWKATTGYDLIDQIAKEMLEEA